MLERWLHREKVPAIHERDLELIIKELGMYEKISARELYCSICESPLTIDTIECLYMQEDDIKICCNKGSCYKSVLKEIEINK